MFVGLRRESDTSTWAWLDGSVITFNNWKDSGVKDFCTLQARISVILITNMGKGTNLLEKLGAILQYTGKIRMPLKI